MPRAPPTNRRRITEAVSDVTATLSWITRAAKSRTASAKGGRSIGSKSVSRINDR